MPRSELITMHATAAYAPPGADVRPVSPGDVGATVVGPLVERLVADGRLDRVDGRRYIPRDTTTGADSPRLEPATLGRGGMGSVYLVHDRHLGRDVALKMLHVPERQRTDPEAVARTALRFLREAWIASQIDHPATPTVYDLGHMDGGPAWLPLFYTMKWIRGAETLHRWLAKGMRFEHRVLLAWSLVDVARALANAHEAGVVHRDVKPENVMFDRDGNTFLSDWGTARTFGEAADPMLAVRKENEPADGPTLVFRRQQPVRVMNALKRLTAERVAIGTPYYMAPEQARAELHLHGPATDVWGLGAVLYEVLTGFPPFRGRNSAEVIQIVCDEPARDPREFEPRISAELVELLDEALHKEAAHRMGSARVFAEALAQALGVQEADLTGGTFPGGEAGTWLRRIARKPWRAPGP